MHSLFPLASSLLPSLQISALIVLPLKPPCQQSALPQPYCILVFYPASITPHLLFMGVQVPALGVYYSVPQNHGQRQAPL